MLSADLMLKGLGVPWAVSRDFAGLAHDGRGALLASSLVAGPGVVFGRLLVTARPVMRQSRQGGKIAA